MFAALQSARKQDPAEGLLQSISELKKRLPEIFKANHEIEKHLGSILNKLEQMASGDDLSTVLQVCNMMMGLSDERGYPDFIENLCGVCPALIKDIVAVKSDDENAAQLPPSRPGRKSSYASSLPVLPASLRVNVAVSKNESKSQEGLSNLSMPLRFH